MYFLNLLLLGGMVAWDFLERNGLILNDEVFMTIISETLRLGISTYLLNYVQQFSYIVSIETYLSKVAFLLHLLLRIFW